MTNASDEMEHVRHKIDELITAMIMLASISRYSQERLRHAYIYAHKEKPPQTIDAQQAAGWEWLFGFKDNAHHYLRRGDPTVRLNRITRRHLKAINDVIVVLDICPEAPKLTSEPSSWNSFLDYVLEVVGREASTPKVSPRETYRLPVVSPGMPRWRLELVGRDNELEQIHELLANHETRVAIVGLPGLGKTSIALAYARKFQATDGQIWWCRAESHAALTTSLSQLGDHLAPNAPPQPSPEFAAQSALRAIAKQSERWLLVYDNAPSPSEIESLLPDERVGVLLTSRHIGWEHWSRKIDLTLLSPEAAVTLLLRQSNRTDENGAPQLAHVLGYLPLALGHAAGLCARMPGISFSEYSRRVSEMINLVPPSHPYSREVRATFTLAIQAVESAYGLVAEQVMAIISHCAPDHIPYDLVTSAFQDGSACMRVLLLLIEVSLVRAHPYPGRLDGITVHRLVQQAGRDRAAQAGFSKNAVEHLARWIHQRSEPDDIESDQRPHRWWAYAELAPHIAAIVECGISPTGPEWPELLSRMGEYFHEHGEYAIARAYFGKALDRNEILRDAGDPLIARDLFLLAEATREMGEHSSAEPLYRRALAIELAAASGLESLRGEILCQLGLHRIREGEITEGKRQLDEGLETLKALGWIHLLRRPAIITQAALLAADRGDYTEACKLQSGAIEEFGWSNAKSFSRLTMQSNLGFFFYKLHDLQRAKELLADALDGLTQLVGSDHPQVARVASSLSNVLSEAAHE